MNLIALLVSLAGPDRVPAGQIQKKEKKNSNLCASDKLFIKVNL
jgi:hypothetical protein